MTAFLLDVKTLTGHLISVSVAEGMTVADVKRRVCHDMSTVDPTTLYLIPWCKLFVDTTMEECTPDHQLMSTFCGAAAADSPMACTVFFDTAPSWMTFTDAIHDETSSTPLTTSMGWNGLTVSSSHDELTYITCSVSMVSPDDSPVYVKAIVENIQERQYTFVGLTTSLKTNHNKNISNSSWRLFWSGCNPDIVAWGVNHRSGVLSSDGTQTHIQTEGASTTQEVWIGFFPKESVVKFVVVTPGKQIAPYVAQCVFRNRSRAGHKGPVYLTVSLRHRHPRVVFRPLLDEEQSQVNAVHSFPR